MPRTGNPQQRQYGQPPPPPPRQMPPQQAPQQGSSTGGGIFGGIMNGMVWGAGSSLGHRVMDGVMGPRTVEVVHKEDGGSGTMPDTTAPPLAAQHNDTGSAVDQSFCVSEKAWLKQCLERESHETCVFYADLLKQCYQAHSK